MLVATQRSAMDTNRPRGHDQVEHLRLRTAFGVLRPKPQVERLEVRGSSITSRPILWFRKEPVATMKSSWLICSFQPIQWTPLRMRNGKHEDVWFVNFERHEMGETLNDRTPNHWFAHRHARLRGK